MTRRVDTSPEARRRVHMNEAVRVAREHGGDLTRQHDKFWTYEGVPYGSLLGEPFPEWSAPAAVVCDLIAAGWMIVVEEDADKRPMRLRVSS